MTIVLFYPMPLFMYVKDAQNEKVRFVCNYKFTAIDLTVSIWFDIM